MKRLVLVPLAVAVLTAVLPTAAVAKGASEAQVTGPGLDEPISLAAEGQRGGEQIMQIAEQAGFFPAVFGQSPDPMLSEQPTGDLGPRYTITYVVPGPDKKIDTITQALYPYAKPAVTQMASGQSFFGTEETRGGWFVASSSLKDSLVAVGLPAYTPAASDDDWIPTTLVGVLVSLMGAAVVIALLARRFRRRPDAATA